MIRRDIPPSWFRADSRSSWHYGPRNDYGRVSICKRGVGISRPEVPEESDPAKPPPGRVCPDCQSAARMLAPWIGGQS